MTHKRLVCHTFMCYDNIIKKGQAYTLCGVGFFYANFKERW